MCGKFWSSFGRAIARFRWGSSGGIVEAGCGEVVELSFIVFSFYIRFCWSGSVRGVVRPFGSIQRAYGLQAGRGVDNLFLDGSICPSKLLLPFSTCQSPYLA